jgi:hypothetical protein
MCVTCRVRSTLVFWQVIILFILTLLFLLPIAVLSCRVLYCGAPPHPCISDSANVPYSAVTTTLSSYPSIRAM